MLNNLRTIVINICNLCNFTCARCPYVHPKTPAFMTRETFQSVIDQAALVDVERIRFLGLSEPTLHPNLPDFINLASSSGFQTHVISNGSFVLKESRVEKFLGALPTEFEISLDAFSSETYRFIRGKGEGFFERLVTRLLVFFEVAEGHTLRTVSFVDWADTIREFQSFQTYWQNHVDRVRLRGGHSFSGQVGVTESEAPSECSFLRDRIFIDWDGTVSVCNLDLLKVNRLGSVHESLTIGNAWSHPRRQQLISGFMDGNLDPQCARCSRCAEVR